MPTDKEIALRALDFEARANDYSLLELPGYNTWAELKLDEGGNEAFIAHLDATAMCLLPEEVSTVTVADFESLLVELKKAAGAQK